MDLPSKIFNRSTKIEFETTIYTSKRDGNYKFLGGRIKRKDAVCILYTIPNNLNPNLPNIKGFQRDEIDKLWIILKQNKVLITDDFKKYCPELYLEGPCCFSAFWGIINILFPNKFIKTHGKISFN